MSVYIVVFEWPATARAPAQTRRIEAPAPEAARLRAAELFAAEPFTQGAPARYYVLNSSGATLYRYPEER